jgi:hypothetical protein
MCDQAITYGVYETDSYILHWDWFYMVRVWFLSLNGATCVFTIQLAFFHEVYTLLAYFQV